MFSRTTTMSMSSGPLPRIGPSTPGIELDRPEVDVLVKVEPQPQQNAFLENAGRHLGVADRSQQDGVAAAQLLDGRRRAGPRPSLR